MERLAKENINTPSEYERIYFERQEKGIDEFDLKRWELLIKYYKYGKFVDLGCLDSLAAVMAYQKTKDEVWGIDFAKDSIEDMKKRHPGVLWHVGNVYDTKFPSDFFQYVVAGELIEHLEYPEKFLKEAFRILKKKGILALSTPLNEKLGEVDAERHLWSFTIEDIKNLISPYGKVKISLLKSRYFPYKYHHRNIIVYCKKI